MKMVRILIISLAFLLQFFAVEARDGHEGTGGGDAEGFFISRGRYILQVLMSGRSGQNFLKENGLDFIRLSQTLNTEVVVVSPAPVPDNNNQIVDATGEPGFITLHKDTWEKFEEEGRTVDRLIFHEMLRSAGYNDDNYQISDLLEPLSQFSEFEEGFRLSNVIKPFQTIISMDGLGIKGNISNLKVHDISRTVEVILPSHEVQSDDPLEFEIKIPMSLPPRYLIRIREVRYHLKGQLSLRSLPRFRRSLSYDYFLNSSLLPPFDRDNLNIRNIGDEGFVFSDYIQIQSQARENFLFKGSLGMRGPSAEHFELSKIVFFFDIEQY